MIAIDNGQPHGFGTSNVSQPHGFGTSNVSQPHGFGTSNVSQPQPFGTSNVSQPQPFVTIVYGIETIVWRKEEIALVFPGLVIIMDTSI